MTDYPVTTVFRDVFDGKLNTKAAGGSLKLNRTANPALTTGCLPQTECWGELQAVWSHPHRHVLDICGQLSMEDPGGRMHLPVIGNSAHLTAVALADS